MIVVLLIEVASVILMRFLLMWENKRRDELQATGPSRTQRDLDATAFEDMTDRENLNFRYIY